MSETVAATYPYRDEGGALLYEVVRYEPKDFRCRKPNGKSGQNWLYSTEGVRRVLYNLPGLLKRPGGPVLFVEGEKDADRLIAMDFAATTIAGGANALWQPGFTESLRDREVILIPDNDGPGRIFMERVGTALAGAAESVRWVNLPGVAPKGDVSDYFDAGRTEGEFLNLLHHAGPYPDAEPIPAGTGEGGRIVRDPVGSAGEDVIALARLEPKPVEWLWYPWLPLGKLCEISGDPGHGKSFVTLDIANRVSRGTAFPDGRPNPFGPQNVLLICCEDGMADTVLPRLIDLGADRNRLFGYQGKLVDGQPVGVPKLPDELGTLKRIIVDTKAKLVVIDPLMAFLGASVNSISDQSVRGVLAPLAGLADSLGVTFLFVRHLNKTNGKQAIYRGGGSIGITASMRSAMLIGKHPHDADKRVLAMVKNNLAKEPKSQQFSLTHSEDGRASVAWEGNAEVGANDLVGDVKAQNPKEWLSEYLGEGPKDYTDALRDGRSAGYSASTLERAKRALGIASKYRGSGKDRKTFWLPPGKTTMAGEDGGLEPLGFD